MTDRNEGCYHIQFHEGHWEVGEWTVHESKDDRYVNAFWLLLGSDETYQDEDIHKIGEYTANRCIGE